MAATEQPQGPAREPSRFGSVVCAALALPGLAPPAAAAEMDVVAGDGLVALRWLSYRDRQPGLDRIKVESPSVQVNLPLGGRWSIDATGTRDAVSGASPRWHSAISGASRMSDNRSAFDARLTRHDDGRAGSLAVATSDEHDYQSRAVAAELRWSSEDNNRTWTAGVGHARDRIGSSDNPFLDERRRTTSVAFGVTLVTTRVDVVQASVSLADGRGFFSDPYKQVDQRPRQRRQATLLLRWNHHVESLAATLRSQWRLYRDSFGVRAQTLGLEWVQPLGDRLTLTPSLRLHTQGAASFYYDPVYSDLLGAPFPAGFLERPPEFLSPDHRLSAFGALTLGVKVGFAWSRHWSTDLKLERYEQRSGWRIGGHGSPGLAPLRATIAQFGLVYRF